MKILFVSGSLPNVKCGVGKYTSHLLKALSNEAGINLAILTIASKKVVPIFGVNLFLSLDRSISNIDLRLAVREFEPDIVHFQFPTVGLIENSALQAAHDLGIAIVQTWHEHFSECAVLNITHAENIDALVYVRENLMEKLPSEIIKLLTKVESQFMPNLPLLEKMPEIEDELVDNMRKTLNKRKPKINLFYFGFINPNKGLLELISILDFTRFDLFISGEIDPQNRFLQELFELVKSRNISDSVNFCGYLNDNEITSFMHLVDAIVFPFVEGVGNFNTSYLAALQSDALIIVSNIEATYYDQHLHCLHVHASAISEINVIDKTVFQKKQHRKKLYDWRDIGRQHLNLYNRIVEKKQNNV